jgi:membrane protein required for colicin V production
MNTLDWVFAAVIVLLGVRCLVRGIVEEVLSVAAIALGLLAGLYLYKPAGSLIANLFAPKAVPVPELIGFAAAFLLAFLLVKLIEKLIREGLEAAKLTTIDRALGLVLGLAEGLLVVSLVLVGMSLLAGPLEKLVDLRKLLDGSFFARTLLPLVGPGFEKATQGIKIEAPKLDLKVQPPAIKKP